MTSTLRNQQEETTYSGYDSMGKPVTSERLSRGYRAVKQMLPDISTEDAMALVGRVAHYIEEDDPYKAMREASGAPISRHGSSCATPSHKLDPEIRVRLDLSGAYRLFATLCCD